MKTAEQVRLNIRWLIRRDFPEVLAIEHASFDHPWTEDDFLRALRQRNCIGMVAEHGERVVAHMVYLLLPDRIGLLNFAVDPAYRRLGVGGQMAAKLVGKLSSHRRTRIDATVRETSMDALKFMSAQGFVAVAVLREHYLTGEDGIHMVYRHCEAMDTGCGRGEAL